MKFEKTPIEGVFLVKIELIQDDRGGFGRVFCTNEFNQAGISDINFVQINHSYNLKKGTFRGMHFQKPPYGEGKLVRCTKGSVCDIVLDLRENSDTLFQSYQTTLSANEGTMIYIPQGLAHGFVTLEDHCELIYHHTEFYQPSYNTGVNVFDPMFAITLPLEISVISEKDKNYPFLNQDFKEILS